MVVVKCSILCSKFGKKSFVGWTRWGPYSAPPDYIAGSWRKGRERGDGRAGDMGRKWQGKRGVE